MNIKKVALAGEVSNAPSSASTPRQCCPVSESYSLASAVRVLHDVKRKVRVDNRRDDDLIFF